LRVAPILCQPQEALTSHLLALGALRQAETLVLVARCSSLIYLPQQALVNQLIACVLGVNHASCAELLQSTPQVAFLLESDAETGVRTLIIGVQAEHFAI